VYRLDVGVVGAGRLGSAIIKGLINGGVEPSSIYVYDVSPEAIKRIEKLGVRICKNVEDLAHAKPRTVIVAVKPADLLNVVKELRTVLTGDTVLVSVAAFISLRDIENIVGGVRIYRAMPNIAVEVNKGFIAVAPPERWDQEIDSLFRFLGEVVWVKEEVLDLLTFVSASTPAVVAELLDVFVLVALKMGVPYDLAKKAAVQVFQGVGKLAELKDVSMIRDSVITPRGVTINLVEKLYTYEAKGRLVKALIDAGEEYLARIEKIRSKGV